MRFHKSINAGEQLSSTKNNRDSEFPRIGDRKNATEGFNRNLEFLAAQKNEKPPVGRLFRSAYWSATDFCKH